MKMSNRIIIMLILLAVLLVCGIVIGFNLFSNKDEQLSQKDNLTKETEKYLLTTDMKFKTMQNDGGSFINIYYDIDLSNMLVNKYEDNYKGFEGYIYQGKLLETIKIDENEVKQIQEICSKIISEKDKEKDLLTTNYSYYTLTTKDYSEIIVNDYSLIDIFLSIVEK